MTSSVEGSLCFPLELEMKLASIFEDLLNLGNIFIPAACPKGHRMRWHHSKARCRRRVAQPTSGSLVEIAGEPTSPHDRLGKTGEHLS